MKLPHANHPIWRIATRALIVAFCLWAYYSKMDVRDIYTIASLIAGDAAINLLKPRGDDSK